MPIVAIMDGVAVMMFYNDDDPPHVHVEFAEHRARIAIVTGAVMSGSLPRAKQRRILRWIADHRRQLAEAWTEVRADRAPRRIV
jgi:hypothetical protein